jgi:Na+/H+ antiporter NhaC
MTFFSNQQIVLRLPLLLLLLQLLGYSPQCSSAFEYVLASSGSYRIRLVDTTSNVSDIPTLFYQSNSSVHVDGIAWQSAFSTNNNNNATVLRTAQLEYTTYFDDEIVDQGSHDLSIPGTVPPRTVTAGFIKATKTGNVNVSVSLQVVYQLDDVDDEVSTPTIVTARQYQVYWPIFTLLPILVLMGLAYLTGNVEITISTANLVTVWITRGGFFQGMEHLVYGCILGALTDPYNGTIMLLVFFLSGIMSVAEISGGTKGWLRLCASYIKTTRVVQILAYAMGMAYFWDDVLSILLVGHLMRPLLDVAHTSRPIGALILDASAGPISGVVMISTWLLWEIPLLQQELSRIDNNLVGEDLPAITMTPWQVLKESLRFAFYPIFYILLIPLLLWSQRHMGQLLMYERITQVYQANTGGPTDIRGPCQRNKPPARGTPCRFWNIITPVVSITILFIVFWLQSGNRMTNLLITSRDDEEWIVTTLAYAITPLAWLQAISMGAAIHVVSILLQYQQGGSILFLPFCIPTLWKQHRLNKSREQQLQIKEQEEEQDFGEEQEKQIDQTENPVIVNPEGNTSTNGVMRHDHNSADIDNPEEAKHLLPMMNLIGSFFYGFARIMPYMIQFILAWALRASLTDMGLDRWFANMLGDQLESLQIAYLPIAAFLTAFFMSLATGGAARGKAANVLLPMLVAPVYQRTYASHPDMIFQVIGAVLSGCIAGDHAAPLSNSTLLSCLASDCHVLIHILTQIPYIGVTLFLSLLVGTGPVGYGFYPIGAGYFLGVVSILFFVFFICYPILDTNGQWDLLTRLYIRCCIKHKPEYHKNTGGHDDARDQDDEEAISSCHQCVADENQQQGSFWEILQRDTARAATALAQGLPYETEDCRHLMHPIDSAVTTSELDSDEHQHGRTDMSRDDDGIARDSMHRNGTRALATEVVGLEPDQEHTLSCDVGVVAPSRRARVFASDARESTDLS